MVRRDLHRSGGSLRDQCRFGRDYTGCIRQADQSQEEASLRIDSKISGPLDRRLNGSDQPAAARPGRRPRSSACSIEPSRVPDHPPTLWFVPIVHGDREGSHRVGCAARSMYGPPSFSSKRKQRVMFVRNRSGSDERLRFRGLHVENRDGALIGGSRRNSMLHHSGHGRPGVGYVDAKKKPDRR